VRGALAASLVVPEHELRYLNGGAQSQPELGTNTASLRGSVPQTGH
jgi:hypothetical protein